MSDTREKTPQELCETIKELLSERDELLAVKTMAEGSNRALQKQAETLTLRLAEQEMHVLERGKEIDRLKAELESRDKLLGESIAQGVGMTMERNLWKSKADKMAKALQRFIDEDERALRKGYEPEMSEEMIDNAKEALEDKEAK